MVRRLNRRPAWLVAFSMLVAIAVAAPAFAQNGMVKGTVRDEKGATVEGAKVSINQVGGTGRKFETRTDKRGEFIQIGLPSGAYAVAAEKEKLASMPANVNVSAGKPAEVALVVSAAAGTNTKASQEAAAALKKIFEDGVAASNAGNHQTAIEKFQQGIQTNSACADCYNNIGYSYMQLKDYPKAEEAYKKATEIRPNDAAAYNGLANVYNAQKKFTEAQEASAKATQLSGSTGGGGADALYNQGVILFNGGKSAEAKLLFEQAIAANPNHAEAHYMLGMSLAGSDLKAARAAMEKYLQLAPTGPNASTAKQLIDAVK
ncbi:MAG: tetratricopeptide repeat protein [Acidimicrobiia bacterium]|nr:tetratricopeptide repeat protein [Acidimicrobiia bacterium]